MFRSHETHTNIPANNLLIGPDPQPLVVGGMPPLVTYQWDFILLNRYLQQQWNLWFNSIQFKKRQRLRQFWKCLCLISLILGVKFPWGRLEATPTPKICPIQYSFHRTFFCTVKGKGNTGLSREVTPLEKVKIALSKKSLFSKFVFPIFATSNQFPSRHNTRE